MKKTRRERRERKGNRFTDREKLVRSFVHVCMKERGARVLFCLGQKEKRKKKGLKPPRFLSNGSFRGEAVVLDI